MRLISNLSGAGNIQQEVLKLILPKGYENMSMIDIGCGDAKATLGLEFRIKTFIDVDKWDVSPPGLIIADAIDYLEEHGNFDVLFSLDMIEHLTKERGHILLDLATEKADFAVFFTPLGELAVAGSGEEYSSHKHYSGWLPEEFEARGYNTLLFPLFHNPWSDGKIHGAFFAWKGGQTETLNGQYDFKLYEPELKHEKNEIESVVVRGDNRDMLSVSIAVHNPDKKMFAKMLHSLKWNTPGLGHVIVVDNASDNSDSIKGMLHSEFSAIETVDTTFIRMEKNVGFGRAHNEALKHAKYPFFAVLNDDIEFFEPWSNKMISVLKANPTVGQVCMQSHQCNSWDHKGRGCWREECKENPEYAEASCMMMWTRMAEQFGLFDDAIDFAYTEDGDLSLRIRSRGFTIKAVESKWVHHRAVTSGQMPEIQGYLAKNLINFRNRWCGYLLTKKFDQMVIVVKRTGSIGDVFLALPVIKALKVKYPDSVIALQTSAPQAVLHNPDISFIIDVGYPLEHDMFIDLDYAYEKDFDGHVVDCYARKAGVKVSGKYVPVTLTKQDVTLIESIIPKSFGRFVVFELGETWPGKQWNYDGYKELAKRFRMEGYKVVGVGITNKPIETECDLYLVNTLSVLQTAAVLKMSEMYVGHEGLIAHMAQAGNLPTVILYGCTTPETFNDISKGNFRPVRSTLPCTGCREKQYGHVIECPLGKPQCMSFITVDMAWDACKELIGTIKEKEVVV